MKPILDASLGVIFCILFFFIADLGARYVSQSVFENCESGEIK